MKRIARISLILFIAWVIASFGIRFVAIMFFGMRNSEISFWVVSVLAVFAVIAWLRYEKGR